MQETERLMSDPAPGITASPHDDNLRYFDVTIQGPDGSPFASTCSLDFFRFHAPLSMCIHSFLSLPLRLLPHEPEALFSAPSMLPFKRSSSLTFRTASS